MEEQILDTIRGIIYTEFPKDSDGNPVIYDRTVPSFIFGDITNVSVNDLPSILFEANASPQKDIAFGVKEIEHTITLTVWNRAGGSEETDRDNLEMARILYEALLPHRRVWVCDICPFDGLKMLTPVHYLTAHSDVLTPFVNQSIADFNTSWAATHTLDVVPPIPLQSGLATQALFQLYEAVANNETVPNISADALANIQTGIRDKIRIVRILYDVFLTDPQLAEEKVEEQLLRGAKFTVTARELVPQLSYGPDNVSTDVF